MTQVADRDLVHEANVLIEAVAGRAQAMIDCLTSCRDAVQASTWRHVGPNRAAENLARLDGAVEEARSFLDATAGR